MKISDEELFEVISVPGVSGYEEEIQSYIKERLKRLGIRAEEDPLGNISAKIRGKLEKEIVFAAHMDELGLVVTNLTDDGKIKFSKIGGIDDRVLPSQHVIVCSRDKYEGVIGFPPPHLRLGRDEDKESVKWYEMFIDVGASSRSELEELGIKAGDPVVFKKHFSRLQYEKISSRGFDDRTGVYLLLKLAEILKEETPRNTVTLLFTVREEIGLHGAIAASKEINPSLSVAVDTINATDYPSLPEVYSRAIRLGNGPVIRIVDKYFVVREKIRKLIEEAAKGADISYQLGVTGGGTDAMALGIYGGPRNSVPICIPTRYTHSTVEVEDVKDIESTLKLLAEIANLDLKGLRSPFRKTFLEAS